MFNKKENKISEESAKEQLDNLLDYYGIDEGDLPDTKKDCLKRIEKAIQKGQIEVKEEGDAYYLEHNLLSGEVLQYNNQLAIAKEAMKSEGDGNHYGRMYAFLGSLSGAGKAAITKLAPKDLVIAEDISLIFLQ